MNKNTTRILSALPVAMLMFVMAFMVEYAAKTDHKTAAILAALWAGIVGFSIAGYCVLRFIDREFPVKVIQCKTLPKRSQRRKKK